MGKMIVIQCKEKKINQSLAQAENIIYHVSHHLIRIFFPSCQLSLNLSNFDLTTLTGLRISCGILSIAYIDTSSILLDCLISLD
jgi:hypothetical protein